MSQGIGHGMWLLAWEFLLIKSVLHFAFLHLLSGCYYYDYVVIGVLRPSWFTEILFWIGLLLSKEVKQLKIIFEFHSTFSICLLTIPYFYQYYILNKYCRPSGLFFFRAPFTFCRTHAHLPTFFICLFFLFHSCSHSRVFWKTPLPELFISYSHTEWYFRLQTVQQHVHNVYSWRKNMNI